MTRLRTENEGKQTTRLALILPRMAADGGYLFTCCDCGLTHGLDFMIAEENGLEMRVFSNVEATGAARERQAIWPERAVKDDSVVLTRIATRSIHDGPSEE